MSALASSEAAVVVRVRLPSPLRSYADGAAEVRVAVPLLAPESPPTLAAVLAALDGRFAGLRFRIVDERGALRPHIRLFVGATMQRDLQARVAAGTVVMIVAALSGG
jgi:molybdopterin converting factor small subunit